MIRCARFACLLLLGSVPIAVVQSARSWNDSAAAATAVTKNARCGCNSADVTSSSVRGGSSSSSQQQQRQQRRRRTSQSFPSIASMAAGHRACRLYVWDAPSALFSRWCNHLQRDSVYEGRGGKKFVRIEPGSMLQLLYPCCQYNPDKCMLCGGSFRDHLTLWWSKHMYTPFDRLVDRVYRDGVVVEQQQPGNDPANTSISKQRSGTKMQHDSTILTKDKSAPTDFCFHRRYVLDITHLLQGVTDKREQTRIVQRAVAKQFPHVKKDRVEQRLAAPGTASVAYAVPKLTTNEDKVYKSRPTTIATWVIVKEMFLAAVENLMDLEETGRERSCT